MSNENSSNSGGKSSGFVNLLIILALGVAALVWGPEVMNFLNDANVVIDLSLVKANAEANNEGINIQVNAAAPDMSWAKDLAESSRAQLAVMQQQLGVDEAMLRIEQARDRCAQIQRDTGVVFDIVAYLAGHDPCPAPPQ